MGKVSPSLSGGDLLNEMASGLEFVSLLPSSWSRGARTALGVRGWSQSELGLELDLDGEFFMSLFLCVRACCFMLPYENENFSSKNSLKLLGNVI